MSSKSLGLDPALSQFVQFDSLEAPTTPERDTVPPRCAVVVDDDDDIRLMVSAGLRCDGFHVFEAKNGLQVIDYVSRIMLSHEARLPDVIVSDARMPGVNGLSLLESLRQCGCDTPLVFMTAYAGQDFRAKARRLGAAEVFEKPFDIDALRASVVKLVR